MKLFLLVLVNSFFINESFCQNSYGKLILEIEIKSHSVITKADLTGVDSSWRKTITNQLNTLNFSDNGAKKGNYTVIVQFIISKDGSVSDVRCVTSPGYGMCEEAVRLIKKGGIPWTPAPQPMRSTNVADSIKVSS